MKLQRTWTVFCLLAVATICWAAATNEPAKPVARSSSGAPAASTNADEIVARVNSDVILRRDLDMVTRNVRLDLARRGQSLSAAETAQLERRVLEDMVDRLLLLQEAKAHAPADLDSRLANALGGMEKRAGGAAALQAMLDEAGISAISYTNQMRDNLLIEGRLNELFQREIKISPEQAREFYDKNPEQFRQPEVVRASHILILVPPNAPEAVKAEKRAQIDVIRTRLEMGEKFADVAREVSEDSGSAAHGGDLGYFPRGRMVPEFEEAAFSLPTNQLSSVVTTQYGHHLILVTDKRAARTVPFEEAQTNIIQYLALEQRPQVVRSHLEQLRQNAKIEILLPAAHAATVETPPVAAPARSK